MTDVNNLNELLIFTARLVNSIDKTLADGKVTTGDVTYVFDPLFAAKPAFDGFDEIGVELADLDETEATFLVQTVTNELELRSEEAEGIAEEGLALALSIVNFVNRVREARS